eukprot:CAMPEP_0197044780 /NCGR_PEP_ID=MMETSP1384-20130603/20757_1 /TAXON_ID=29189 /ORGANISM="Ammonia sp." /LENGTH=394 /DNA_ID=CAMNT_0042476293 /DNA_START=309 /DNA_END=1493 /DNA_ORIENTATION=+
MNLKDIITDIGVNLRKVEHPDDGKVIAQTHSGFHTRADYHFRAINKRVQAVLTKDNNKKQSVVFTGHSKGGAVAVLHAFEVLRRNIPFPKGVNLSVITFGAPLAFAEAASHEHDCHREIFAKLNSISHQFVNKYDGVPRLLGARSWAKLVALAGIRAGVDSLAIHKRTYARFAKSTLDGHAEEALENMKERLQSYFGVGTYYVMHDHGVSMAHAEAPQVLHQVLYAREKVPEGQEGYISSEVAAEVLENHAIAQYMETLKTCAVALQSAAADQRTKDVQRAFDEVQSEISGISRKFESVQKSIGELKQSAGSMKMTKAMKQEMRALRSGMDKQEATIRAVQAKLNGLKSSVKSGDEASKRYKNLRKQVEKLNRWQWILTLAITGVSMVLLRAKY